MHRNLQPLVSKWFLICAALTSCVLQSAQAEPPVASHWSNQNPSLKSTGNVTADALYRYLADKGADYFRKGRFAEAEKFFQAALANAKVEGVQDRRMAMLLTNLATDLREEEKYSEAEPLFERAVELERSMPAKDKPLMLYTARQYAGLLRQTDRDDTADAILAAAHAGFEDFHLASNNLTIGELGNDHANDSSEPNERTEREHKMAAQAARPNFEPLPVLQTEMSVTAQLRDLAEIERTYAQQSQSSYFPHPVYSYSTPFGYASPFGAATGFHSSFGHGGHSFSSGHGGHR